MIYELIATQPAVSTKVKSEGKSSFLHLPVINSFGKNLRIREVEKPEKESL